MTAIYRDITEGTYYPAASLYTLPEQTEGATVTFNFGEHNGCCMCMTVTHEERIHLGLNVYFRRHVYSSLALSGM